MSTTCTRTRIEIESADAFASAAFASIAVLGALDGRVDLAVLALLLVVLIVLVLGPPGKR